MMQSTSEAEEPDLSTCVSFHLCHMGHLDFHGLDDLWLVFHLDCSLLCQDIVHHLHNTLIGQRGHGALTHSLHGLYGFFCDEHGLYFLCDRRLWRLEFRGQVRAEDADGVLHLRALVVELQSVLLQHDLAGQLISVELGYVLPQRSGVYVGLLAQRAYVRALTSVSANMALQRTSISPCNATGQTLKGLHSWGEKSSMTSIIVSYL